MVKHEIIAETPNGTEESLQDMAMRQLHLITPKMKIISMNLNTRNKDIEDPHIQVVKMDIIER